MDAGFCWRNLTMLERQVAEWIANIPEPFRAAILAGIVALLRILYDGKEPRWTRRFLECALCGAITLAISNLIQALGMSPGWSPFLGGAVGLMGADQVRTWGRKFANSKVK